MKFEEKLKKHFIGVKISDVEKGNLNKLCEEHRLSVSELVRYLIEKEIEKNKIDDKI